MVGQVNRRTAASLHAETGTSEIMPSPLAPVNAELTNGARGTLAIDGLIFFRALTALNMIVFARIIVALMCIAFALLMVVDHSKSVVLIAIVGILLFVGLGRCMIAIAVGIVHDRNWAIGGTIAFLLLYDASIYNWYFIKNHAIADPVGFISGTTYLNAPFVIYLARMMLRRIRD